MKMILRASAAAAATMLVLGCKETTSSQFIKTGGIAAFFSVTADNPDTSKVRVELDVGGNDGTAVILDSGDKLTATANGETDDLASVSAGVYETTLKTAQGVEFAVSLERTEEEDALNNRATLPNPFSLTQPAETDSFSRANDAVHVLWTPVVTKSNGGTVSLSGPCISAWSQAVSGTEAAGITIDKATLKSINEMKPESCKVTLTVTFIDHGTVDPAFDADSQFTTSQSRTVTITSDP